jgi:meso-butanediol dehydrogenase / (S,S)-butanediol dehydrogenase / diacetyl reductase
MSTTHSVIITGGASGTGLATARLLGADNWSVVLVDRDQRGLDHAEQILRESGVAIAAAVSGDIKDPDTAVRAVMAASIDGLSLRGLVNCAAATCLGTVESISVSDLDDCYAVNVRGTFLMIQAAVGAMRRNGGGSIVNVGSADSFLGEEGTLAYCTTKGAVLNLTRAAAMDLAAGRIRVNCVCPGVIDTPFFRASFSERDDAAAIIAAVNGRHPMGILQPDDVAAAIAFLIGDGAAGMTGSVVVVDRGLSASWRYGPIVPGATAS